MSTLGKIVYFVRKNGLPLSTTLVHIVKLCRAVITSLANFKRNIMVSSMVIYPLIIDILQHCIVPPLNSELLCQHLNRKYSLRNITQFLEMCKKKYIKSCWIEGICVLSSVLYRTYEKLFLKNPSMNVTRLSSANISCY